MEKLERIGQRPIKGEHMEEYILTSLMKARFMTSMIGRAFFDIESELRSGTTKEVQEHLKPFFYKARQAAGELGQAMERELKQAETVKDQKYVTIVHKPTKLRAVKCDEAGIELMTLNGSVVTNKGDWIITGINGEQYPCDPEIFKELYEVVGEDE